MTPARRALLLLAVVAVVQAVYYHPLMPDVMASHFRADGRPDGFQSRDGFFLTYALLLGGMLAVFLGLPAILERLPTAWFNLPNREYWLAPERRAQTIGLLGTRLQWFGVATMLLLLITLYLAFEANRTPARHLDPALMWGLLVGYLAFTAGWLVELLRTLRRLRAGPGGPPARPLR